MTVLSLGTEIATYLQTQGVGNFDGAGTINLFVSVLPDTPDNSVAIFEHGGYPPTMWLTGGSFAESPLDNPVFQVRIRDTSTNYSRGQQTAQTVYSKLHGHTNARLNGVPNAVFVLLEAVQSPVYLGRDPKQRHEWTQNFHAIFQNLAR